MRIESTILNLQVAAMAVAIYVVVVQVGWIMKQRSRWLWSIPTLTWMIHILAFYIAIRILSLDPSLATNPEINVQITIWSAWVRLHGLMVVAILETARLQATVRPIWKEGSKCHQIPWRWSQKCWDGRLPSPVSWLALSQLRKLVEKIFTKKS